MLCPHFLLNLLPLHAAEFNGKPLLEHYPITYLPTPSLAGEIERRSKPCGRKAVFLGNPTGDLKWAELEVRRLAKMLSACGMLCHSYTQTEASVEHVYIHSSDLAVLHGACHSSVEWDDFLHSGLILADRRLTVFEVINRLELPKAALVYLSSCDSGKAVPGRTDELMAIVRAFLYAGAPSVVASLWPLNDCVGQYFAERFYEFWIGDERSLSLAFQKAFLQTRTEFYDQGPAFWAPFVLMGNGGIKGSRGALQN